MHYNDIFVEFWQQHGFDVVYQPSCLQNPYSGKSWPIKYPDVVWRDNTVVIMHCRDFLSISNDTCVELQQIQNYFGKYSHRVIVIHWNYDLSRVYTGPLNLIYFPTHTYEILNNLQKEPYLGWQTAYQVKRTRRWQCLNGIARPHRRLVHSWLKDKPNGLVTLRNIDPLFQDSYDEVYKWTGFNLLNEDNFLRLSWLYSTTEINIVTETQYLESPGIISEKTILALLAGQIPIVIGYKGIVADCKAIGIDMFEDLVDTSYDNAKDVDRWRMALELNADLLFGQKDLSLYRDRLNRQRDRLLYQWPGLMIERYCSRCRDMKDILTKT